MVSLLPPPTHEGGALSCWPGNRARRTASFSVGPVGRESGSADCCHLGTSQEQSSVQHLSCKDLRHLLRIVKACVYVYVASSSPWFFNGKGIVSLSLLRRFFISLISLKKKKTHSQISVQFRSVELASWSHAPFGHKKKRIPSFWAHREQRQTSVAWLVSSSWRLS